MFFNELYALELARHERKHKLLEKYGTIDIQKIEELRKKELKKLNKISQTIANDCVVNKLWR